MSYKQIRTSTSHPLQIAEVSTGVSSGLIGITFCPGKHGGSLRGYRWERNLDTDLDVIVNWGANAVVTLIEDHEFIALGVPDLGKMIIARGIDWHHLPIVDVSTPDARFNEPWKTVGPRLIAELARGGKVLVHCRGGLGRAGMVAACLLVEAGVASGEAIRRVRAVRSGAIETVDQEIFVDKFAHGVHKN